MQILHIIQTLSPRYGGPTTFLTSLSQHQAREGHEVTICTTNTDFPQGTISVPVRKPLSDDGVTKWYHSVQSKTFLFSFSFMNWIKSSIGKFNIIHIHGLYRFPVTYAASAARRANVPYIIRPHGALNPSMYRQSRYSIFFKRLYEKLFDFPNINGASTIHFTSQEELNHAKIFRFDAPAVVIPNGIEWSEYAVLPHRGDFRKRIGLDMNTPFVLFLGRINFIKGLDLLIPAFSMVKKALPTAHLAIVGPDNEGFGQNLHRWCREYKVEKNVHMVGHIFGNQVLQAYVDADVFVLPSYTESFGMTVVEAMACGCPVVISDQVNIWTAVKKAKAGVVVKLETRKIADAMLSVLNNKDFAKRMGHEGRKTVQNHYTCDHIAKKVNQMYESIIIAKSPRY